MLHARRCAAASRATARPAARPAITGRLAGKAAGGAVATGSSRWPGGRVPAVRPSGNAGRRGGVGQRRRAFTGQATRVSGATRRSPFGVGRAVGPPVPTARDPPDRRRHPERVQRPTDARLPSRAPRGDGGVRPTAGAFLSHHAALSLSSSPRPRRRDLRHGRPRRQHRHAPGAAAKATKARRRCGVTPPCRPRRLPGTTPVPTPIGHREEGTLGALRDLMSIGLHGRDRRSPPDVCLSLRASATLHDWNGPARDGQDRPGTPSGPTRFLDPRWDPRVHGPGDGGRFGIHASDPLSDCRTTAGLKHLVPRHASGSPLRSLGAHANVFAIKYPS